MTAEREALGRYGEDLAARRLIDAGMVVLDRNWRCDAGELDLVLRDGRVLVICEVKTRSSLAFGSPLEAVTPRKLQRLRRLGARWIGERGIRVEHVRIDMVGIVRPRVGTVTLDHIRGIG